MESPRSPRAPLSGHRRSRPRLVSPKTGVYDDDDMRLREAESTSHYLRGEGVGVDDEMEATLGAPSRLFGADEQKINKEAPHVRGGGGGVDDDIEDTFGASSRLLCAGDGGGGGGAGGLQHTPK